MLQSYTLLRGHCSAGSKVYVAPISGYWGAGNDGQSDKSWEDAVSISGVVCAFASLTLQVVMSTGMYVLLHDTYIQARLFNTCVSGKLKHT